MVSRWVWCRKRRCLDSCAPSAPQSFFLFWVKSYFENTISLAFRTLREARAEPVDSDLSAGNALKVVLRRLADSQPFRDVQKQAAYTDKSKALQSTNKQARLVKLTGRACLRE